VVQLAVGLGAGAIAGIVLAGVLFALCAGGGSYAYAQSMNDNDALNLNFYIQSTIMKVFVGTYSQASFTLPLGHYTHT